MEKFVNRKRMIETLKKCVERLDAVPAVFFEEAFEDGNVYWDLLADLERVVQALEKGHE